MIPKFTKTSSFIFFVILISISTSSLVYADHPLDADGDGVKEGIVHEIIGLLKHPEFGLEAIKDIVKLLEGAIFDPDFGLEAIDDEVEHIETELHNSDYGLDAIDDEVEHIEIELHNSDYGLDAIDNEVEHLEGAVFDSDFGLEEIDDEVEALQATFSRIEEDVDDVEEIVNDIEDDMDMAKSDITMIKDIISKPSGTEFVHLVVSGGATTTEIGFNRVCPSGVPACGPVLVDSIVFDPNIAGEALIILTKMCVDDACGPVFTAFNSFCAGGEIPVFIGITVDFSDCQLLPLSTGDGENTLLIGGVGTLTGGKITIKTSSGYPGNVEFDIWAPEGTTFNIIKN